MCLGEIATVTALEGGRDVPVALVRMQDGTQRRCDLVADDVSVGCTVLVHMGYVVEVLDPGWAAEAIELRATWDTQQEATP